MRKTKKLMFVCSIVFSIFFSSCIATNAPVVGKGSSLSSATTNIVFGIKSRFDFSNRKIQISANNFWEKGTRLNLPFSSVLAEALSSEFSKSGARILVDQTDETSLKAIGTYIIAGKDVLITVRLRHREAGESIDLAVLEDRISRDSMDPRWLEPEFQRIARSLVRLLEFDYKGMPLKVWTPSFEPGSPEQSELVLGEELAKYMKDALGASPMFRDVGASFEKAGAVLTGEYLRTQQTMVFHVSLKDKVTSGHFAGAKMSMDIQNIPKEVLTPKSQSFDGLARKIFQLTLKECSTRLKNQGNTLYIGTNSFHDTGLKAITPFGHRITQKLKDIFSETPLFSVTDDPSDNVAFILSGQYGTDADALVLSVDIHQIEKSLTGCRKNTISSVQGNLDLEFCDKKSLVPDVKGYTDFLMYRLEQEAMVKLPCIGRTDVMVHKFKFENKKEFSKLSEYLNGYFLDYFASSPYFSPVTHSEKKLTRSLSMGTRTIVVTKTSEATIAAAARASHYITGSLWPRANGDIEIKTTLKNIKGDILASEQGLVKNANIDKAWLSAPEKEIELLPPTGILSIELFTQKGRNNLSFRKGEEIVFFAQASKPVYVKIFTSDAEHSVFRIFPNDFEKENLIFQAGEVTSIPNNQYNSNFKFEVQGTTGKEQVIAFASDLPLPDLPGSKHAAFGMKQVNLTLKEITDFFVNYTVKRGISLSWDFLPILTQE